MEAKKETPKTNYTDVKAKPGFACHFEKNGMTIRQVVDKMFNDKAISLEDNGKKITILQSGHLGCTKGSCDYNRLFGEPANNGEKEFRFCKLLEVDPTAAGNLDAHVRTVELEKMLKERDKSLGADTSSAALLLKRPEIMRELALIEQENKKPQ